MDSGSVLLANAAATAALGAELARRWLVFGGQAGLGAGPTVLLLEGNLGAGKTSLVQGLAAALGIDEAITSPSFALAQHYGGRCNGRPTALVHLDLYRLEQPAAADELFAQEEEEALALGALMAVEWPGRLSFEPEAAWHVELQLLDPERPEAGRRALLRLPPDRPAGPQ